MYTIHCNMHTLLENEIKVALKNSFLLKQQEMGKISKQTYLQMKHEIDFVFSPCLLWRNIYCIK